jgi:hypothetical protein
LPRNRKSNRKLQQKIILHTIPPLSTETGNVVAFYF